MLTIEKTEIKNSFSQVSCTPKHVAIIMDGNRRWAKLYNKSQEESYFKGGEVLRDIISAAADLEIKVLTVYSFSTENWKRTQEEIDAITRVLEFYLIHEREEMVKNDVKLETIGDLRPFSKQLLSNLQASQEATKNGKKIELILALNYGGRDEIRRAVLKSFEGLSNREFTKEDFTERHFAAYLDTARWSDPELLIRTGGDMRLSNFLLWQLSYTEVVFSETLWPDFTKQDFYQAISEYQKRNRRMGV